MKFLHLSDLHLGKRVHAFSMLEDQRFVLEQIAQMARAQRVDAVVIAGDIYDKSIPPAEAVGLFDSFFTSLRAEGIPVLAIGGNHDSGERLNFGQTLLARQGVYLAGTFGEVLESVELCDADGCRVQFHLLPWLRPMELRERMGLAESTQQCAVQAALETAEWDDGARHVLLAHAFVTAGGALPEQSESEIIPVGGLDAVDAALFDKYDYVALGHLHRAQRLGRDSVRYAGSPLKYSFSEAKYPKSVPLVTLGARGEAAVELFPLRPKHEMREIRGRLADVTSDLVVHAGDPEDYLRVILTDEEELYDPQGALKEVYPNLMRLDFDNARTRAADTDGLQEEDVAQKLTPAQLFAQFFAEQNGKEMNEWQQQAVARICRRMEEADEAD